MIFITSASRSQASPASSGPRLDDAQLTEPVKEMSRLRTIPGEAESLEKVSLGLAQTNEASQRVSEHLDALFSKQVEMGREATMVRARHHRHHGRRGTDCLRRPHFKMRTQTHPAITAAAATDTAAHSAIAICRYALALLALLVSALSIVDPFVRRLFARRRALLSMSDAEVKSRGGRLVRPCRRWRGVTAHGQRCTRKTWPKSSGSSLSCWQRRCSRSRSSLGCSP